MADAVTPPTIPTSPPASARPATAPAAAPAALTRAGGLLHHARTAIVGACTLLALLALVLAVQARHGAESETADAAAVAAVARSPMLAAEAARLAAMAVADTAQRSAHAAALRQLLPLIDRDATLASDLLRGRPALVAEAGSPWSSANAAAAEARDRLTGNTARWLLAEPTGEAVDDVATARWVQSLRTLQADAAAAVDASARSHAALRAAVDRIAAARSYRTQLGNVALLVVLLLGAVGVDAALRSSADEAARRGRLADHLRHQALVAEHTSALVLVSDRDDHVVWVNDAFTRVSGWTTASAAGRRPTDLMASPHADPAVLDRVRQALKSGRGDRHEWLYRLPDGQELWLDVDMRPLHDDRGDLAGFVRVGSDVTQRVQQQAKLEALWKALPTGVVVHDAGGTIVDANRAAEQLLGLSLAQLQGGQRVDSVPSEAGVEVALDSTDPGPAMRTLATGIPLRNHTLGIRTPAGERRWLLVNTEPLLDSSGQIGGVVSCFGDATESRLLNEQLSSSARTDALTRLPNRAVVMERLQRAVAHARRHPGYGFAVLFMDFDRFKQVNDTLGHGAGDELLRQVADRLQLALRPGDAVARVDDENRVAARIGGDEFVVVLEGVADAATVAVIADRLLQELAEPYLVGSSPVQSSASIGIVLGTGGNASADEVLRNADTAMYEAKRAGRGRWVMFDDSMHERVVRALAVENDLRAALKRDELFVMYQPVVDLATRRSVGIEALVRWRHPLRGLVPPVDFIGIAEEAGLIDAVGSFVLRESCLQFARWQVELGELAPRHLAVNLSRAQLKRSDLVDEVRSLLTEVRLQPAQLQLEITESLAAQDDSVQTTLRQLKALGVKLALDDFGTGYSSLACLHQLPVDTVKVDRSFVSHAENIEYHRVLIEATIRVARALGMTTVAEGIETEGQAALMLQLDCDRGQGYLYSRPLLPADYASWVLRESAAVG